MSCLSLLYLLLFAAAFHRAGPILRRRCVRRSLDARTGLALLDFSASLATQESQRELGQLAEGKLAELRCAPGGIRTLMPEGTPV